MYDTSPESWARGAVYRLLFISIAFICCEYKEKAKWFPKTKLFHREQANTPMSLGPIMFRATSIS